MTKMQYVLSACEQKALLNALNYFLAGELATLSAELGLPNTGQRHEIISRIYRCLTTLTPAARHNLPAASLAKEGAVYPLRKETLILKGSYQTNAATKNFLKRLAGDDFYFSPSSQDWIALQWQRGLPPTYGELARYFKGERLQQEQVRQAPPEEWARATFEQHFLLKNPTATKQEVAVAWEKLRAKQCGLVRDLIDKMNG